jgi:hypothetical protein
VFTQRVSQIDNSQYQNAYEQGRFHRKHDSGLAEKDRNSKDDVKAETKKVEHHMTYNMDLTPDTTPTLQAKLQVTQQNMWMYVFIQ